MHHPIQMKPADTENRNGNFQLFFLFPWALFKNFNQLI